MSTQDQKPRSVLVEATNGTVRSVLRDRCYDFKIFSPKNLALDLAGYFVQNTASFCKYWIVLFFKKNANFFADQTIFLRSIFSVCLNGRWINMKKFVRDNFDFYKRRRREYFSFHLEIFLTKFLRSQQLPRNVVEVVVLELDETANRYERSYLRNFSR
jgi:hypothetical protein